MIWNGARNKPQVERQMPVVEPPPKQRCLTGPDEITGTVREIVIDLGHSKCRLWNDPMDRWIRCDGYEYLLLTAKQENKSVTVTTEKLNGRWMVTKMEQP